MKRFLKSAGLSIAKRRGAFSSPSLAETALGLMGINFEHSTAETRYPNGARAACVISLDFDHLTRTNRPGDPRWYPSPVEELLAKNRLGTKDMLDVSEKYSVPMTWAMCGRTTEEDPESYKSILGSSVKHEIGVHTYSHADVKLCSAEELRKEVERCLDVLNLSEHPKTFVFPWNRLGHFDLLSKMGFIVYRDPKRTISAPRENSGLLNLAPTYYVDTKSNEAHSLMRRYLDLCISWNSVFHLWLHPWSVVFDATDHSGRFVRDTLEPLFSYIKQKRDENVLATSTMGDLATFWREQGEMRQSSRVARGSIS